MDLSALRAFIFDLTGLLTMPLRTQIEGERFQMTQTRITEGVREEIIDAIVPKELIDKNTKYQQEKGQWELDGAYLPYTA